MWDVKTGFAAAIGQAPSRELIEVQRDFDRATVRRVRRMVRRGQAAPDPRLARLAVAIAHDLQRGLRLSGRRTMAFFVLIVAGWPWEAWQQFAAGRPVLGALIGLTVAWGIFLLGRIPVWRRNVARAERLNREALESAGGHADAAPASADDSGLARPSRPALIGGVVAALIFYTGAFGAFTLALSGEPLTLGRILARGAAFGIGMTVLNLTVMRRRNERAARRG